ncbi:hypothetical protein AVEN_152629-1, partial [Araneus ventricosus]
KSLASKLPTEGEAFEEKVELWRLKILRDTQSKLKVQKSIESDDTLFGAGDMPEET